MTTVAGRLRATGLITIGALTLTSCQSRSSSGHRSHASFDTTIGDSAFRSNLRRWLRDSIVLDSVTQVVNTDTLYQLYRQALERKGVTLALMSAVACEELRLAVRYGSVPSNRAINRLLDTVYRDIGVTDGLGYFASHAPSEGEIETGPSECKPFPSTATKKIGNTRLDMDLPPRPRPE
jgi:hypothetical protein